MNEGWPDIYGEGYMDQFKPGPNLEYSELEAETLILKIPSHGTSLKWSRRPPLLARE